MVEDTGVHRVLVRKPEGKRPLGRPRRKWDDNIKMDLQNSNINPETTEYVECVLLMDKWK